MILDLEFKKFKTLEIREEIRQEYDNQKSRLNVLEAQIKAQLKTEKICEIHNPEKGKEPVPLQKGKCVCEYIEKHMEIAEIERMYDQKVLLKRDMGRFLEQMKGLDIEVKGAPPSSENHAGTEGINQTLDSLVELKGMVRDYTKQI